MYIVIGILLFSFLIFIHELGHFIAAKLSGVQVNEFALFMGPKIWSKTKGETTYRLNCLPIGGYCAMEGEDEESDNPRAFGNAKVWKRLIILCAGSFMNFAAGFLMLLLLTAFTASFVRTPVITELDSRSDLAACGIQVGDRMLEIDGRSVLVAGDISMLLERNTTGVFDLSVERDGQTLHFDGVKLQKKDLGGEEKRFGLAYGQTEKLTVGNLFRDTWNNCRNFVRMVYMGLEDLFTGRAKLKDISGPAGIMALVNEAGNSAGSFADGLQTVIWLFSFIAINLAVMNMLPIPALDGGRVVALLLSALFEKLFRRKLNPKVESYVHGIGMVLLLAFMALITFKDIWQMIT